MKLKDTFVPYLEYMRQKGLNPKTIAEHKRLLEGSLSHSISEREVSTLRPIDAVKVMEAGRAHGAYGPQRSVVIFRRLIKFLKDSGEVIPFDWRDLELPKVPQKANEYLTPHEIELLFNSFDTTDIAGLRTRALCEVLLGSGMRISEAISLDKKDIDWEHLQAIITNIKTKDQEPIYFTARSLEWLKKYLDMRKDNLPYLFVSGRGRMLAVTARNYLRTHTDNLGIRKHIKFHLFRKTFTTLLIQGKIDISAVKYLARHKSPRTTLRYYTAVDREKSKEAHQEVLEKMIEGRQ